MHAFIPKLGVDIYTSVVYSVIMKTITYAKIIEYLDRFVSGQDEAKEQLAVLGQLYSYRSLAVECGVRPTSLPRLNMFLTGPTGTGKTLLVSKLAECLDIPTIRIDCSCLCQVGWAGVGIDDHLYRFSRMLPDEGFGIVILDEFDKLGHKHKSSSGEVPTLGIQYNLLDILDGKYSYGNTSSKVNNCLILCAGAFSEATEVAQMDSKSIGFLEDPKNNDPLEWKKVMVDGGIVPELVGRMVDVIETKRLTKAQIRDVILHTEGSIPDQYKNLQLNLRLFGDEIDELVDDVHNSKFGLRELDTAMFNLVKRKMLKR